MDPYLEPISTDDHTDALDCTCNFSITPANVFEVPQTGTPFGIDIPPEAFGKYRGSRYTEVSIIHENFAKNHLQGLQRHHDYLFATGADWNEGVSHLFVMKLDHRDERSGRLEKIVALDNAFAHAGGFQRLGDILPIPMESENESKIIFVNVKEPSNPRRLSAHAGGPLEIPRPGSAKAGAAAIANVHLGNGHGSRFLLVIGWDQPGGLFKSTRPFFDFYLSATDDLRDGFVQYNGAPAFFRQQFSKIQGKWPAYQALSLISGASVINGELEVWMTGLRCTGSTGNYWQGSNLADLIGIHISLETLLHWPVGPAPVCAWAGIPPRQYFFKRRDGNFAAAAGFDTTGDNAVTLYAAHHWRTDDHFRLTVCKRDPR